MCLQDNRRKNGKWVKEYEDSCGCFSSNVIISGGVCIPNAQNANPKYTAGNKLHKTLPADA
jgi:hypothetical protein